MSKRGCFQGVLVGFVASGVLGCGGVKQPEPGQEAISASVTYWKDVKPLLEARCVSCHQEHGSGPMPLDTYADAAYWAEPMRHMVTTRTMPPWTAGPDCSEYVGDPTLTDEQIALVERWIDEGAVEGDPSTQGPALVSEAEPAFRRDRLLTMAEAYTPRLIPDEYRCFLLPWEETTPRFLRGVGLVPGNPKMVHHSVVSLVPPERVQVFLDRDASDEGPGYTCFTGTSPGGEQLIGAIEKAENGWVFPHGVGLRVEPGSMLLVQQHYNTLVTGGAEPDRSSLEVMIEDDATPGRAVWFVNAVWMLGQMPIPAGAADVVHAYTADAAILTGANASLHWADLHMHVLGSRGELSVLRADGTKECLLRVDDWRFSWQQTFRLKNPVSLAPGDQLHLECHFDNTARNQFSPMGDPLPPRDVAWGDKSTDEMCLGNFLVTSDTTRVVE